MNYGRKLSGGKYHKARKRKLYEKSGQTRNVKLGEIKKRILKTRSGAYKTTLLASNTANIIDKKTNKAKISKIINVLETPSNRFLARQNIITKGTLIETELGKARVTSRPSQESAINAILIHEEKK
ncbi:MAG: 30S ribosomal protein S8e [Nanoarchaeota archaeon]